MIPAADPRISDRGMGKQQNTCERDLNRAPY